MALESELVLALLEEHPADCASVLERVPATDAAGVLARVSTSVAAGVLASVTAQPAGAILQVLAPERAAALVELQRPNVAATYLRRMQEDGREAVLKQLPETLAQSFRSMLRYPERSAGALLDPEVLALPDDLLVREATERVRTAASRARYNIYVTDRSDLLVGALNLRELLLARPSERIERIMTRQTLCLRAMDDQLAVIAHPGWQRVHSLPVVDERGTYLGAVRYATLRRLEAELLRARDAGGPTVNALGELFWAGMSGLLDGMAGPRHGRTNGSEER